MPEKTHFEIVFAVFTNAKFVGASDRPSANSILTCNNCIGVVNSLVLFITLFAVLSPSDKTEVVLFAAMV